MEHKVLVVKKESAEKNWMKNLPVPLKTGEKVIVNSDQTGVAPKYIKVKHGPSPKAVSIFHQEHFNTIAGKSLVPKLTPKKR